MTLTQGPDANTIEPIELTESTKLINLADLTELNGPTESVKTLLYEDLITMVQSGIPVAEAAEELGISTITAYTQLKGSNILAGLKAIRDTAVIAAYQGGMTLHNIVQHLGVSQATIYTILRKHDIPRRRKSPRPFTDKERQTIIELYQAGESVMGIVAKTQRHLPQIYQILHNADVKLRRG
jgi:transposase